MSIVINLYISHYRETINVIIQKIGYDYGIGIVELEIPEEHIHMVIRSIPRPFPSDVMQVIKKYVPMHFTQELIDDVHRSLLSKIHCLFVWIPFHSSSRHNWNDGNYRHYWNDGNSKHHWNDVFVQF